MNVLHFLDSLNRGGAETLVLDVCRNAERCGLNLTFVASGGGDLEKDFENSGVEYIRLQRRLPVDLNLVRQSAKDHQRKTNRNRSRSSTRRSSASLSGDGGLEKCQMRAVASRRRTVCRKAEKSFDGKISVASDGCQYFLQSRFDAVAA